jgi:hypothetical protein
MRDGTAGVMDGYAPRGRIGTDPATTAAANCVDLEE